MRLSVKALAITSGLVWGGAMLTCGLVNLAARPYGRRFLELMSSVYPGFHNSRTLGDVLVGAGYGFVDGAVAGSVIAAVYNQFANQETGTGSAPAPAPAATLEEVAS
jgi:hypothetical protein